MKKEQLDQLRKDLVSDKQSTLGNQDALDLLDHLEQLEGTCQNTFNHWQASANNYDVVSAKYKVLTQKLELAIKHLKYITYCDHEHVRDQKLETALKEIEAVK